MKSNSIKFRLALMLFLNFAVWGAYLTSQGRFLGMIGMGAQIKWFFAVQGFVSIFMPALIGIVADKFIPAQKMLSICHWIAGASMIAAGFYGVSAGDAVQFAPLFSLYTLSVAFFMPTIALTNSVSYDALGKAGYDTVKDYPPIRMWGTVGFIIAMYAVDLTGFQNSAMQYIVSGVLSIVLALYALTLPQCSLASRTGKTDLLDTLGLKAFSLFKEKKMAVFFVFSFLLGAALQVSNGYANTFLAQFSQVEAYQESFAVKHSNILLAFSQISETLCILLIPFFLKKFGIKTVMAMAMFAWAVRFGGFGLGNPNAGLVWFIVSMLIYGVAFDFFNISGSLYVEQNTNVDIRSSAQGLFMLMTNGLGASIGTLAAGAVVERYTAGLSGELLMQGWSTAWYIFAAYSLLIGLLFLIFFKNPQKRQKA